MSGPGARTRRGMVVAGIVVSSAIAFVASACSGSSEQGSRVEVSEAAVYLSPTGSDEGACRREAPCLSLARGYEVAGPGEVIELAGGAYPAQEVLADPAKASGEDVVVRPAPGARVSLEGVEIHASHLELRDLETTWYVHPGADRVTLRRLVAPGGNFITSASNVRVIGGEIGPGDSVDGLQVKTTGEGDPDPSDILLDGVEIHDFTRVDDPGDHTDCVQVGAAVRLTIRNSRIHGCATQGVFFSSFAGGRIADLVVENNWFGSVTEGYYSLILKDVRGALIRNNSATTTMIFRTEDGGGATGLSDVRVVGNIGPNQVAHCVVGGAVRYEHNVWSEAACGPTDRVAPPGFVDAEGFDLRLAAGSAAIDAGDPDDAPTTDILGRPRHLGDAPDAGAHEAG